MSKPAKPARRELVGEVFTVRVVAYGGDDYLESLGQGFEIVDKIDSQGKNERVLRKPKSGPPFAMAKLDWATLWRNSSWFVPSALSSNNVTIDAGQLFGIGVLIASSVSLALYVIEVYRLRRKGVRKETLEDRIKQLTMALLDASKVVGKVETEIEERRELVRKLEQDAETYKNIANLHKSELDAVGQVFRGELKKERRRGFIQELSLNLFFFLLGVAVTFFLFRRWWHYFDSPVKLKPLSSRKE